MAALSSEIHPYRYKDSGIVYVTLQHNGHDYFKNKTAVMFTVSHIVFYVLCSHTSMFSLQPVATFRCTVNINRKIDHLVINIKKRTDHFYSRVRIANTLNFDCEMGYTNNLDKEQTIFILMLSLSLDNNFKVLQLIFTIRAYILVHNKMSTIHHQSPVRFNCETKY